MDLLTFGSNNKKHLNDASNKSRELVVTTLINASSSDLETLRGNIKNKELFTSIVVALESALQELTKDLDLQEPSQKFRAVPKGGMGNNHDFDLYIGDNSHEKGLAVELKKGKSIYDQPQFLSLYVKNDSIITKKIPNYAEYFYDMFFSDLQAYSQCNDVPRLDYLKNVFGTKYEEHPFIELYEMVKKAEHKEYFQNLQYVSIDSYIREVTRNPEENINWQFLQDRLYLQLPKYFLSWSDHEREFHWERFNQNSLTLTGDSRTKSKSNGLHTSLVLPTKTGQQLDLLLRWKNNPCVKGPAWQIKLSKPIT